MYEYTAYSSELLNMIKYSTIHDSPKIMIVVAANVMKSEPLHHAAEIGRHFSLEVRQVQQVLESSGRALSPTQRVSDILCILTPRYEASLYHEVHSVR